MNSQQYIEPKATVPGFWKSGIELKYKMSHVWQTVRKILANCDLGSEIVNLRVLQNLIREFLENCWNFFLKKGMNLSPNDGSEFFPKSPFFLNFPHGYCVCLTGYPACDSNHVLSA